MALPSSGEISLGDIQTEFGGTNPISIIEYYRGGGLVPDITVNNLIPSSGVIKLSDFYNGTSTGTGNLLSVTTASSGFPPIYVAYVYNQSTSIQTFTFTWKYVGHSDNTNATIFYDGIVRSPGYTTPTLSQTFNFEDNLAFEVPFAVYGIINTTAEFEFTLITASVDTVPTPPSNKTTVFRSPDF